MNAIVPIPGFEKHYGATVDGRIFSFNYRMTGRVQELAQATHPEGYKRVKAWHINRNYPTPVHRLVALAFIPNPDGLPQVNHLDGDKGNNQVENLEWVTNGGNQLHAFRTGLQPDHKGENHPSHKLTDSLVLEIRRELDSVPAYKGQQTDIARRYGVTNYTIHNIKHRQTWGHL